MTPAEYLRLAWADARNGDVDYTALPLGENNQPGRSSADAV
jgi:hypothetical protein